VLVCAASVGRDLVTGLIDGGGHRIVVEGLLAGDGDGAAVQVHLYIGDAGDLLD
jgi:hypothetical protein